MIDRRDGRDRSGLARSAARLKDRFHRRSDGPDVQNRQSGGDGVLWLRIELRHLALYVPFANVGIGVRPQIIAKAKTASGKLLYQRKGASNGRVIAPNYVAMMNTMMQEILLTGTARKAAVPRWQAAGKTGTSQDWRDAWFIGYTSHLVAGVWLGNDDNSPTKRAAGGNLPVEIWSRFMRAAHQGMPPEPLPGGVWQGGAPLDATVPMADNNSLPFPSSLPGAPASDARAFPPARASGAPVPPADIPNPGGYGQKRGAQSRQQNFFDTLFGR